MTDAIEFESMSDAFAHCREVDKPVLVIVDGEVGTVYPSGYFRPSQWRAVPNE